MEYLGQNGQQGVIKSCGSKRSTNRKTAHGGSAERDQDEGKNAERLERRWDTERKYGSVFLVWSRVLGPKTVSRNQQLNLEKGQTMKEGKGKMKVMQSREQRTNPPVVEVEKGGGSELLPQGDVGENKEDVDPGYWSAGNAAVKATFEKTRIRFLIGSF